MSEWFFFSLLGLSGMVLAAYPLRQSKRLMRMFAFLALIFSGLGYVYWGSYPAWKQFLAQQDRQSQARAYLSSIKDPQILINQFLEKLKKNPKDAKGWFLLGKLYGSFGQWDKAAKAYERASILASDNEEYAVYAHLGRWQVNQQVMDEENRNFWLKLLDKNSKQPDALAMLAMDAYASKQFSAAIAYWQRLLEITPPQSSDAKAIRQAIAKAEQEKLLN